jgi:hypothetical protein
MKCEFEQKGIGEPTCCEGEVKLRHAMTAYHFEGVKNSPEDPNRDFYACEGCYQAYVEYWQYMWDEYYSSVR